MHKGFLRTAAILGVLAVTLGAFGAHGLRKIVPAEAVATFETGVRYHFYHTLALLAIAILFEKFPQRSIRYAGISFITGIVLFSGSLYVLTLLQATDTVGLKGIGAITPIGGLFFIVGWLCLFAGIGKKSSL
ncbi:DUF423 domain-containing protein [Niastella caeni]|uniref:DUF423 domain-containing protein n=1 Tax=Niastella caeni TaxID=2569763 RepID=A0A4S8HW66_9BACT|nr:DUF423 domain-containing protein [Niastella caeni]THU39923.1 DUF423 domain-containing protein [Niastella caeni]